MKKMQNYRAMLGMWKYNLNITEKDFIKCGSPLGEYELHCDKQTKEKIERYLTEQEKEWNTVTQDSQ